VFFRAPALKKTLLHHAPYDVGQRRPVDARLLNEVSLTEAFVLGHGDEHRVLSWREIPCGHLRLKNLARALPDALQEMNGRSFQSRASGCHPWPGCASARGHQLRFGG